MPLETIPVAYRAPFDFGGLCYVDQRPAGDSVLDIVRSVPNLPRNFAQVGYVCINGEIVPRELWAFVRPKPPRAELHVAVTLHVSLRGGGGGGRSTLKTVGAIVAAIALIVVTQGIASGAFFGTLGSVSIAGATITGAQVLAGAVGIAGALAISALTAPPTAAPGIADNSANQEQAEAAGASGNILDRGGSIPRVIGTRKIFPPLACQPVVELVDQDEVVEALFILNGPHALSDIRLDGTPIADAEDVEYETHEGWPGDPAQQLIRRQGHTTAPQLELSTHSLAANGVDLLHQSLPQNDLPVWHGVASRSSPDEIWLHLLFPGGIFLNSSTVVHVPLRIRFRKKGTTSWTNVPEIHIADYSTNQRRAAILFKWATADPVPQPPTVGFVYARLTVPGQTDVPATPAERIWTGDPYFDDGSGNYYLYNGNAASTRIRNMALYDNRVEIFLDAVTFPKGIYEIQIKRGAAFLDTSFLRDNYNYVSPGTVRDFFWYRDAGATYVIPENHSNISDRGMLVRAVSIWNEPPMTQSGNFSIIALTALNRSIQRLSCIASGYVRDWDGSGWNTWITTSNPAPHYADVLSGALNLDPLPVDLRDDTALVAWRTLCIANDWTCDTIVNDTRTQDALDLLASCGFARPYQSDVYGVIVDNDRTGDAPVQVFSRRNCANLRYERSFARLPAGFNVTYRDEDRDEDQAQITVYQRDPDDTDLTLLESISYDGLIDVDKVTRRAQFDLDQASLRATFYYLDVDIESIVCRRGSLIAVEHDILFSRSGDGYIDSKQTSAGNITGVTLDAEIPIISVGDLHSVGNMHDVNDMHALGISTGIVIRRTDGSLSTHQLSNGTGVSKVLTFSTPFADVATIQGYADNDRRYGCLVVSGSMGSIYRRLLVQSIQPQKDLQATMVLVDEAPQLVR